MLNRDTPKYTPVDNQAISGLLRKACDKEEAARQTALHWTFRLVLDQNSNELAAHFQSKSCVEHSRELFFILRILSHVFMICTAQWCCLCQGTVPAGLFKIDKQYMQPPIGDLSP